MFRPMPPTRYGDVFDARLKRYCPTAISVNTVIEACPNAPLAVPGPEILGILLFWYSTLPPMSQLLLALYIRSRLSRIPVSAALPVKPLSSPAGIARPALAPKAHLESWDCAQVTGATRRHNTKDNTLPSLILMFLSLLFGLGYSWRREAGHPRP